MQNNNKYTYQRSKPEITLEYLEELKIECDSELANKNKYSNNNKDDEKFINNVIDEETKNDKKRRQINKNKSHKKANTYPSYNSEAYSDDENTNYINTLEAVKKQREKVINSVYKNILTDEFPKNAKNKELALEKLSEYQYVTDIYDLSRMRYIRYFTTDKDGNTYLASGGLLNKIKNGKILLCQFANNAFWSIPINSIVFKKMKEEEKLQFAIGELIKKKTNQKENNQKKK